MLYMHIYHNHNEHSKAAAPLGRIVFTVKAQCPHGVQYYNASPFDSRWALRCRRTWGGELGLGQHQLKIPTPE
jgi:hypothetical protein